MQTCKPLCHCCAVAIFSPLSAALPGKDPLIKASMLQWPSPPVSEVVFSSPSFLLCSSLRVYSFSGLCSFHLGVVQTPASPQSFCVPTTWSVRKSPCPCVLLTFRGKCFHCSLFSLWNNWVKLVSISVLIVLIVFCQFCQHWAWEMLVDVGGVFWIMLQWEGFDFGGFFTPNPKQGICFSWVFRVVVLPNNVLKQHDKVYQQRKNKEELHF